MVERNESLHAGAPREDFVLVACNLETISMLFQTNDGDVRQPFLPYRLHQRLRHQSPINQ